MARAHKPARVHVLGRRPERAALRAFLRGRGAGLRVLVISGEAGIGKTTLWLSAIERETHPDDVILIARPAQPETRLSFGVLRDLLAEEIGQDATVLRGLPAVQRRALTGAIEGGPPADEDGSWLSVAVATLSVLRTMAEAGRVVVAIDDLQWADEASLRVLQFALRRVGAAPITLLATQRLSLRSERGGDTPDLVGLDAEALRIGPMTSADLAAVLHGRIGALPSATLRRIHDESGANPFVALEIARVRGANSGDAPVGRMRISTRLRHLTREHLASLTDEGLEAALLCSAMTEPTMDRLAAASVDAVRIRRGLEDAERVGVLEPSGDRWRFTHPLLASAVYDSAAASDRRLLHDRLASIATDPEQRAWHMALATTGQDEATASALAAAAGLANARGAPDSALALLTESLARTSGDNLDAMASRRVEAARCLVVLDRPRDALEMLGPVMGLRSSDGSRAAALQLSGLAALEVQGPYAAADFAERALRITTDPTEALLTAERYAGLLPTVGKGERVQAVLRTALRRARASGIPTLVARARINQLLDDFQAGRQTAARVLPKLERIALELPSEPFPARVRATLGQVSQWADDVEAARVHWTAVVANAAATGDELQRAEYLGYMADLDVRTGAWDRAEAVVPEILELSRAGDGAVKEAFTLCVSALILGGRGDMTAARSAAHRGLALAADYPWLRWRNTAALGLMELSRGNHVAAAALYDETIHIDPRLAERRHGVCHVVIDRIEAKVAAGQVASLGKDMELLDAQVELWDEGWCRAGAARARAAVRAADGDLGNAVTLAIEAVELHKRLPYPLELGRSLLAAGALHRRAVHLRDARALLSESVRTFETLGARPWIDRANAELRRVGGRSPVADGLTPSEAAVAELVALGLSNAEVATRLVLATRTVESHLTQIYAKLGLRSRAELIRLHVPGS